MVALFGATGLGKTEVAVALAERLGAEVVIADSMQVYRGLPIVTNQPSAELPARVRYHLVGSVEPSQEWSVAAYAEAAHAAIDDALARGARVVVEGGSGLYLRAALGELAFAGRPDPVLRRELEEAWGRDPGGVTGELRSLDPATAARLDLANPRRVIRALEAVRSLGRPLSETERGALWRPPERYAHRLRRAGAGSGGPAGSGRRARRRDARRGRAGRSPTRPSSRPAVAHRAPGDRRARASRGRGRRGVALEAALAAMRSRTHALVRRQLTWMRKLPDALREPAGRRAPDELAAALLARLGDA